MRTHTQADGDGYRKTTPLTEADKDPRNTDTHSQQLLRLNDLSPGGLMLLLDGIVIF